MRSIECVTNERALKEFTQQYNMSTSDDSKKDRNVNIVLNIQGGLRRAYERYGQDVVEARSSHGRKLICPPLVLKIYPEVEAQAVIQSLMGAPQFTWLVRYAV